MGSNDGNGFIVACRWEDIPDSRTLIDLIGRQIQSYGGNADPERIEGALRNALREESRACLFLREDQKSGVGAFAFGNVCSGLESGGDYLWINELHVDEALRRRGMASELLAFIEDWAADVGIVYIACSTGVDNRAARQFYNRCGYDVNPVAWVDKDLEGIEND